MTEPSGQRECRKDKPLLIALLDDYQNVGLSLADWSKLGSRAEVHAMNEHIADPDLLCARLQPYDAVMAVRERTKFPSAVLQRLPNLKLLVTAGMWNAAIDLDAAASCGVQVCGTGGWPYATAELALALMLALARQIPSEDRMMRAGQWQTRLGLGLHGKTLGVLGLGKLGQQMAKFGTMLGMEVLSWSQNLTQEAAAEGGAKLVSKNDLLARSDVVSIHLKLSARTEKLIGTDELRLMKPTAYLINTSRGPIIDEAALIDALRTNRLAGAGIDVYDIEPLPSDHPFRALDNIIMTPHIGYVVEQNHQVIYRDALEDIEAFLDGRVLRPLNSVRP
jgi:phosphoglycerate dehydrogenase-like enzyme